MPTYEYLCTDHGHRLEVVQKFTDDALTVCPECGGHLRKVIFPVGVVFKGSGFYRNDSRSGANGGSKGAAAETNGNGGSTDGVGKDSGGKDGAGKDGAKGSGSAEGTTKDGGSNGGPKGSGSNGGGTPSSAPSADSGPKSSTPTSSPTTAPAAAPGKATSSGPTRS